MTEFQHHHGIREASQLLIGLTGPSGGGKTLSALLLATGMVEVIGGKIFIIDTDGGKCLEYAPAKDEKADPKNFTFDFEYVELVPPYGSLRYRDAILYCAQQGASVIIIDTLSHEHDGDGGYLEFGEKEAGRVGKAYGANWRAPKMDRKKLIQSFAQSHSNLILCFRAEEKLDWNTKLKPGQPVDKDAKKGEPRPMGWMPVGGQVFSYELNVGLILQPAAEGTFVADRNLLTADQKMMFKVREYFKPLLAEAKQIDMEMGRKMELWASGGNILTPEDVQRRAARAVAIQPGGSSTPKPFTGPDESEPCPTCKNNVPRCIACNLPLIFTKSGLSRAGEPYHGFWRCPNKCANPKDKRRNTNRTATDWHAILEGENPKVPELVLEPGSDG